MVFFEVLGDDVAPEVPVEVTPCGVDVITAPVVELDKVFLGLDPEVGNVAGRPRDEGKAHGGKVQDLLASVDLLDQLGAVLAREYQDELLQLPLLGIVELGIGDARLGLVGLARNAWGGSGSLASLDGRHLLLLVREGVDEG